MSDYACFPCRVDHRLCPLTSREEGACGICRKKGWECQGFGEAVPGWYKDPLWIAWVRRDLMPQTRSRARISVRATAGRTGARPHVSSVTFYRRRDSGARRLRGDFLPGPLEQGPHVTLTQAPVGLHALSNSVSNQTPGCISYTPLNLPFHEGYDGNCHPQASAPNHQLPLRHSPRNVFVPECFSQSGQSWDEPPQTASVPHSDRVPGPNPDLTPLHSPSTGLMASSGATPIPDTFPSSLYCEGHYGGHEIGHEVPANCFPTPMTRVPSDGCWDSAPLASNGPIIADHNWWQPQAMPANNTFTSTTIQHLPLYHLPTTAVWSECFDQNGPH